MKVHKWFNGEVVGEYESDFNGQIQLIKHFGKPKIIANGLLQSGGVIKNLWSKPLNKFVGKRDLISDILLLGLGGGTLIEMFGQNYKGARCVAVEIDPVMIRIAKNHFLIDVKNINAEIVHGDAFVHTEKLKQSSQTFDLGVIDLFYGRVPPPKLKTIKFLKELDVLVPKGKIIFNCLFSDDQKDWTQNYIEILDNYFGDVKILRNLSNMFILVER